MLTYPDIDPVLLSLGPLKIRWYGLMYVVGFSAAYFLVSKEIAKRKLDDFALHFENLNFILILSLICGARVGYALFYNFSYYAGHPLEILAIWQGGMSFHGALLGVLLGGIVYCRRHGLDFWQGADIYVVPVPIGLGFGRLGNFINGELFGRPSSVPWGMVFPHGGPEARHPSQLYEACLEGVVLFCLLWLLRKKKWPTGSILGIFLVGYGLIRAFVELFREPDPQLGFIFGPLTMGQLLSLGMVLAGTLILIIRRGRGV